MNSLGGFLRGGGGPRMQTHGSIEDLLKATLGDRFVTDKIAKPEEENNSNVEKILFNQSPVSDPIEIPKEFADAAHGHEELSPFQRAIKSDLDQEYPSKVPPSNKSQRREERVQNREVETPRRDKPPVNPIQKYYSFFRDIEEVFECSVTIEGTMNSASARLILMSDTWNLVFQGKLKKDGTCMVPIKKLSIFPEGTTGRASLEVIVDDVVFVPWESPFKVEESRKVKIDKVVVKGRNLNQ